MNQIALLGIILACTSVLSKQHEHREHGAHVHGSATVSIAFDQLKGKIELKSPSDSIIGFEYKAESAKDKKTQEEAMNKLDKNISEIISFDRSLGCKIKKEKLEVVFMDHGQHSEVQGAFNVECAKSPLGTQLTFNFQKFLPRLKDVDVQVLIDQLQKSFEAQKSGTTAELK